MREQRRWICGQMGELVSAPHCRISSDFDFIKETLGGFLWIQDNHRGAGDNCNNGISNRWIQSVSTWRGAKSLFVPCDIMVWKGLHHRLGCRWGGLEREDLDCHLVSIPLTTPSSDLKPPVLKQSSLWVLLNENICSPSRAAWITSGTTPLC